MIILNEREFAQKLLQNGYIRPNKHGKDIFILCKYFKSLGYSKLKCCKEIIKFINKYNEFIYYEIIRKEKEFALWKVNTVYKYNYNFREFTSVDLSQNEIDLILGQKTNSERQVLFVLIILNKFFANFTGTFYFKYSDLFELTSLSKIGSNSYKIINKFIDKGILQYENKYRIANMVHNKNIINNIRLMFKLNIEHDNNYVFSVNSIDFMKEYAKCMNVFDKNNDYCEGCGKILKRKNNKHKYCSTCAKEILREQWKKASKKYYYHKIENSANMHE